MKKLCWLFALAFVSIQCNKKQTGIAGINQETQKLGEEKVNYTYSWNGKQLNKKVN